MCIKVCTWLHYRHQGSFDDTKLMHLPALDEQSMNRIMQKRIKEMVSPTVDTAVAPPQYITLDENFNNQESKGLIICDGCTRPISSSE